jgi:hypothetical protein
MPNYKQTTLAGTAYTRASSVAVANPLTGVKAINFFEEQVVNLGDEVMLRPQGGFQEPFTTENATTEFPLVNPETGEPIGQTATYMDLYVTLHSLYLHLAQRRDAALAAALMPPEVP